MDSTKWKKHWKSWVAPTRVPGVWKRKEGGFLVRVRVVDPITGRPREIRKVMPDATEATARKWLADERARIKSGEASGLPARQRFCDFAVSLMEEKVASGDIKTVQGQDRWRSTLVHLIGVTSSSDGEVAVTGFGELYLDQIRAAHVDAWRVGMGKLIAKKAYAPTTVNSWLAILRVIDKAAKRRFELPRLWMEDVPDFDLSEHIVYTEEEPNSLPPEKVPEFLECMQDLFPQHFAMTFLGFATGLRPSSMRPLRRKGPSSDVLWDENRIRVRRSQTRGEKVLNSTKQRTRYGIEVPPEVMDVLRWHVETQIGTPEQQDSELLFPAVTGGFRAVTALVKPFRGVAKAMKLGFNFTPRGMRRTFNDLARTACIEAVVTRSISGHLTERMQEHYSTVRGPEQREGIAKVVDLMTRRKKDAASE
jgi:integrase